MVYVKKSNSKISKTLRNKSVSKVKKMKVSKPKKFKPKIQPIKRFEEKTKRGSVTL